VFVTVGTLDDGEVEKILGTEDSGEDIGEQAEKMEVDQQSKKEGGEQTERLKGAEWFEDLLGGWVKNKGGAFARISRFGVRESDSGSSRVIEWEIVEWDGSSLPAEEADDSAGGVGTPVKRKVGDAGME
jgi:hypothetical protein